MKVKKSSKVFPPLRMFQSWFDVFDLQSDTYYYQDL